MISVMIMINRCGDRSLPSPFDTPIIIFASGSFIRCDQYFQFVGADVAHHPGAPRPDPGDGNYAPGEWHPAQGLG